MTQSYGCLPYGRLLTNSEEQEPVGDLENLSTRLGLPVWRCECETIVSASVQWERLDNTKVQTGIFGTFLIRASFETSKPPRRGSL